MNNNNLCENTFSSFAYYGILVYLTSLVFEGPIRYVFYLYNITYLLYVRDIFILVVIAGYICQSLLTFRVNRTFVIVTFIFIFHFIVALFYVNILQPLFAWKIYLLLFFGILYGHLFFTRLRLTLRIFLILLLCAVIGVAINYFKEFPWEGLGYSLGGVDIEAVRSWSMFGIKRPSGFARNSFDAAGQILLLAIFLFSYLKNNLLKIFLWLLTAPALLLTTTKGIIMTYFILTAFLLAYRIIPDYFKIYQKLLYFFLALVIILPIISIPANIYHNVPLLLESFFMRVSTGWPEAFQLVQQHGNLLLGRGLGGMGTSQMYFETATLYNPGDNIFLIFYGNLGLLGVAYLFYLAAIGQSLDLEKELFYYLFILSFFAYGITTACIDHGLFCLFLGIFLGYVNNQKLRTATRNGAYCMT